MNATVGAVIEPEVSGALPKAVPDEVLWVTHPSPWMHGPKWGLALLSCVVIVGIPWAGWLWLVAKCTTYTITRTRIKIDDGVLTKRHNQLELYRVRDVGAVQPWWMRPVRRGNVDVFSTDASDQQSRLRRLDKKARRGKLEPIPDEIPKTRLWAIESHMDVMELVRAAVEESRRSYGIRAVDIETMA